jgi:hypothetical protein
MHAGDGETTSGEADHVGGRWQRADADFLRGLLALPELALVAESCPAERSLHERLVAEPTCAVGDDELAALADADARDNYATFSPSATPSNARARSRRTTSRSSAAAGSRCRRSSSIAWSMRSSLGSSTTRPTRSSGARRSCCIAHSASPSSTAAC